MSTYDRRQAEATLAADAETLISHEFDYGVQWGVMILKLHGHNTLVDRYNDRSHAHMSAEWHRGLTYIVNISEDLAS